jgi:hypothetical protein
MTEWCEWEVGEPPGYWHWHCCSRKAVETRDGHGTCRQHAKLFDDGYRGRWVKVRSKSVNKGDIQ